MNRVPTAVLALLAAACASLNAPPGPPPIRVMPPPPALYAAPSAGAKAVARFDPSEAYTVLAPGKGGADDWYQVVSSTGTKGWVRRRTLEAAGRTGPVFVTFPKEGERFQAGERVQVTWRAQSELGTFNVRLMNKGRVARTIEQNTAATVGRNPDGTLPMSFSGLLPYYIDWTVPEDLPGGGGYSIRVSDLLDTRFDQGPPFALVEPARLKPRR